MSIFRELGIEISDHVSESVSAEKYLKSNNPDMIIFREKPPDMDAAAFTAYLSGTDNPPVCIVIGPEKSTGSMRECFLNGAADYLSEPLSEEMLRDAFIRASEQIKKNESRNEYCSAAEEFFIEFEPSVSDKNFYDSLCRYIIENEGKILSTHDAADHFGFNRDYFGRLFRSRMGLTFGTFYKRFRMKYAERLLKTGRYKVCEIAAKLGFSEPDYFTTEFRKYIGRNPIDVKIRK